MTGVVFPVEEDPSDPAIYRGDLAGRCPVCGTWQMTRRDGGWWWTCTGCARSYHPTVCLDAEGGVRCVCGLDTHPYLEDWADCDE